jgi:purine-binding chemotaxis protein CheW
VKELVSFRIGREDFGVDILMVQEIIRLPEITPIPNAPGFIVGVINLRGKIIPVVDLRQRLKILGNEPEGDSRKTRIMIIELNNRVTGFIVDTVVGILKAPASEIEPTPDLVSSSIEVEYIAGVIKLSSRLIILLDFMKILKPREKKDLDDFEKYTIEGELEEEEYHRSMPSHH